MSSIQRPILPWQSSNSSKTSKSNGTHIEALTVGGPFGQKLKANAADTVIKALEKAAKKPEVAAQILQNLVAKCLKKLGQMGCGETF